jgi:septum formation protein
VVGAIALTCDGGPPQAAVEITQVHFRPATAAQLDFYVKTGEWQGRAGGYAIQGIGAVLVAGIEGDYLNVVGLPLARLLDLEPALLPA